MKALKVLAGMVIALLAMVSCDEDTVNVGNSISQRTDLFTITTDSFRIATRSLTVDSVVSRSEYCYIGRIKDPETGSYVTSDYMTQLNILENDSKTLFPEKDSITSLQDGLVMADSVQLNIMVNKWQGDSLAALKLTLYELQRPVEEGKTYYTNFDPIEKGYIREDGLRANTVFSIANLQLNDSIRDLQQSGKYYQYIRVPINGEYTAPDGKKYNNYGTYLMRTFYEHPEYFKDSYHFVHKVCPGFYAKITNGMGLMSEIYSTQLIVFFRGMSNGKEYNLSKNFLGTEEVMQTMRISNDKRNIKRLVEDNSCTYLKTPAGIFTEVTLPVEDIKRGHETDSLTAAKVVFNRINTQNALSEQLLSEPTALLMVEKDSLASFFENQKVTDNKTSYLASYSSSQNTYTYANISNLVNHLYAKLRNGGSDYALRHPDWNKVVLVPVKTVTSTSSSVYGSTSSITGINNEMNLTSIRLVGGSENKHMPLRITVIYNKND